MEQRFVVFVFEWSMPLVRSVQSRGIEVVDLVVMDHHATIQPHVAQLLTQMIVALLAMNGGIIHMTVHALVVADTVVAKGHHQDLVHVTEDAATVAVLAGRHQLVVLVVVVVVLLVDAVEAGLIELALLV